MTKANGVPHLDARDANVATSLCDTAFDELESIPNEIALSIINAMHDSGNHHGCAIRDRVDIDLYCIFQILVDKYRPLGDADVRSADVTSEEGSA